jgi:hypothetical protein
MSAILQLHRFSQQSQVGLMHQSGALQRVVAAFGLQVVMSQAPQLLVDQKNESLERVFVALPPMMQKRGDLAGLIFGHAAPLALFWRRPTGYSYARRSSIPIACHLPLLSIPICFP